MPWKIFRSCRGRILSPVAAAAVIAAWTIAPAGADPQPIADRVFVNGAIYTQDPAQPWAEGFAIGAGKYLAVGSNAAMRLLMGPRTRLIDLHGRMVMSGLIDDHVHAVDGALGELYECLFPATAAPAKIRKILARCVRTAPPGAWVSGGHWDSDFFEKHAMSSPRRWLDEIARGHPIILRDDTGHNTWVNSAALKIAKVQADTEDPPGGRFGREPNGRQPNGIAFEAAAELVQAVVPPPSAQQLERGVSQVETIAHRFGIIGLKEADADYATIGAYHAADQRGALTLYVATCISTLAMQVKPDSVLDIQKVNEIRATYASGLVATDFVKIYLDGVPTTARTAAMIAPYLPDPKGDKVFGDLHVDPEVLAHDLVQLDRLGYTVKMHAAGDRAVRTGLDAIAAARRANPKGSLRHELAHAGFIAAEDLPRFAQLNAVAEFSPVIWYPSPIIDAVIEAVGERAQHYWPIRSLLASHAPLAAGSDWPSVVPSMDPWGGIQAMVTRSDPYHHSTRTLWPEEAISLADALRIYTLDGAAALRREAQTGSIVAGKSADFIILDRNLFKIPADQISKVNVDETFFRGRMVYSRSAARPAVAR